jgi:NAD(P)-dependent dehydrogenase (short-subunit alcohol dehydrogenase family)
VSQPLAGVLAIWPVTMTTKSEPADGHAPPDSLQDWRVADGPADEQTGSNGTEAVLTAQDDGTRRQRALVTGATAGLGRAIAQQLGRDGLDVIVHGRDADRGRRAADSIAQAGGSASFVAADVSTPAGIVQLAADVGDVDVLVNNAGFSWFGATADLEPETFDALFASNVRAPYFLVAAFAPGMAARGGGTIVNISSMAARIGLASGAVYGATKAALESLTRAWAAEFSPRGVRVNAVAPGPVYTDGAAPERTTALGATTALARAADAAEIASVVSFLVSPAASYITGAVLAADGGRTAI